ncbi:MAG TPA: FAD/NAD(P)-binding oxidoreductase [Nitrososphaera sp.]|nr:FAD/NAD(P)-binding oxidoreductase [Nitrososphaera sp.]
MGKRIVILGAGFGGLAAANALRKGLSSDHRVIVVDRKDWFMMGLVKLWVLEGSRKLEESRTPLAGLNERGIEYLNDEVTRIDLSASSIETKGHGHIGYDYLIVALGAELVPDRVPGFAAVGHNLYDPLEVPRIRERLLSLKGGKVAITIMGMPYKCPPAPYEASIIVSGVLTSQGTRGSTEIDVYSPAPIAMPVAGPQISSTVVEIISQHGIRFNPLHKLKSVAGRNLEFENGEKKDFDLLIGIPPHRAPGVVRETGLVAPGSDWVQVDSRTMKTSIKDVFAVGDVTEIKVGQTPIPKAGIFAEEEAKVVAQQIIDEIGQKPSSAAFSGEGYCFMEVGGRKAGYLAADFFNETGPKLRLEAPSEESFRKKQDFERTRIKEWLL